MNLLLINYEFPPVGGGAATATFHIGKELASMGHNISILTSSYKKLPKTDLQDGMQIVRCPALRKKKSESNIVEMLSFVISAFFQLPFIIKKRKIDGIIVFFGFPCGPLGLWANILFQIPYIISLRGGDVPGTDKTMDKFHRLLTPVRRLIYKKSKAVVANSEGLKSISQQTDPIPTIVIPNGIDTSYFKPARNQKRDENLSFIFVGRLSEQKNLYFLIEQFSILKNEINIPFIVNIVGDGTIKIKLQHLADNLGISDIIKWHGWLTKSQVLKLLQNSDCFINPSLCEGMPNAVLEAQACGLPIIASDVSGNNSIVDDGENGLLFSLGDDKKMNNILKRIIENLSLRSKFGVIARKKMLNNFTWSKTAGDYADIFITSRNHIQRSCEKSFIKK